MSNNTQQGLQNQMFGVLVFLFVVISLILQIIPVFVIGRELYEARFVLQTLHPDRQPLTSILTQGAQMPYLPLGRFRPFKRRCRTRLEHWSRYHLFLGVVLSDGPFP